MFKVTPQKGNDTEDDLNSVLQYKMLMLNILTDAKIKRGT